MSRPLPRFGPYPTHGVLGEGGMGTVYLARHPELGYELAIKTLVRGRGATAAQRKRFQREVRSLGHLRHPGIVEILDAGEQEGVPWLAMRRVEGGTLEERLRGGGPLAPAAVIGLGLQLCAALGAAHDKGILHRDLKPDNVLCRPDGGYVVTDFGLTKDVTSESVRLSQTGALQGTPGYWAPEQASGQGNTASFATDVYGVGALLYAALTGVPPITGESLVELSVATLERPPTPPSALAPAPIPASLERVVLRCLSKSPEDRYSSLAQLAEELQRIMSEDPEPEGRGAPGYGLVLALLVTAALAGAGVVLALARPVQPPGSPAPSRVEAEATPTSPQPIRPSAPSPPATSATPDPSPPIEAPNWYRVLSPGARPPLPLPAGLSFGAAPLEYLNRRDGSVLLWIPGGTFAMGAEAGEEDELPVHVVTLGGYFLGKYETTWRQYQAFCERSGRRTPTRQANTGQFGGALFRAPDDHPVFHVSWSDAVAYCEAAGLRLPSEAEWEFAARGPEGRTYPWGEDAPSSRRLNLADEGADWDWPARVKRARGISRAKFKDGFSYTAPVGSYPAGASPFGCLDMGGNVHEWVQDLYRPGYEGAPRNGLPLTSRGSQAPSRRTERSVRGGSWNSVLGACRAASRGKRPQGLQLPVLGFRPAKSYP